MRVLRPLIIVLGGVRVAPIEAVHRVKHARTVKRKLNGVLAAQKQSREHETLLYPTELKAANRFRKNANKVLRGLTYSTPLGRVALQASVGDIIELREHALREAVIHNRECPHWQVLVEGPTWADMTEDAQSVLLTVLAGRLPEWMFQSQSSSRV